MSSGHRREGNIMSSGLHREGNTMSRGLHREGSSVSRGLHRERSSVSRFRRLAPLAACLTVIPFVGMAEGLPQLDFKDKLTVYQVIWGAVIFVVLYILASRSALPKVESVLEERAQRIAADLESAKDAKARADSGIQAAVDATAKARSEAQTAINTALDQAKQAAAAQTASMNERLDKQLKEAESQIAAARGAALLALPGVATDAANALIARLTGSLPDPAKLSLAINAAMAARGAGHQG